MERQTVNSSTIKSAGWEDGTLELEFASGGIYQYAHVPKETFEAFMRAESKGHFFQVDIRPSYVCERLHTSECLVGVVDRDCGANGCTCWCHKQRKDVSKNASQTAEKTEKSPEKKAARKTKRTPV